MNTAALRSDRLAVAIGRQLAYPNGWGGSLIAALMRLANGRPNRLVLEALDLSADDEVLDIGCGDGSLVAQMREPRHVVGIDRSPLMLEAAIARNRQRVASGSVEFVCGDMLKLPFPNQRFTKIVASNVLYFCADLPAFVTECRRVARPGAGLVVYVTSKASMEKWPFASAATHRHFSAAGLRTEFGFSGQHALGVREVKAGPGITGLVASIALHGEASIQH